MAAAKVKGAGEAEIHDLGYAAYQGPRTPHARRFLAIARNVFGVAWKARSVKVLFAVAGTITVVGTVAMYLLRDRLATMVRMRGVPIPQAEQVVFNAVTFYSIAGFALAAVVGCAAVANDLRMGSFQFYFSRPIRPRDYLLGKLLGVGLVVGVPMFAGPVVLALVRLLLSDGWADLTGTLPVVPHALLLGVAGTAGFALPALGLGALVQKRQPAQALFAVYFILISPAAMGFSVPLHFPYLRLVALQADIDIVGRTIFGLGLSSLDPPAWAAAAALTAICAAGLAMVVVRVRSAETAGLGGS